METLQTVPVLDIIQESPDTQTFRLGASLTYKAGQAISLLIPGDPKKRYYSLSSSPSEKDVVTITVKADRESPLFASLFSLRKGSQVQIAGPLGSFTLPDQPTGPFYFLAAGSGVSPFRSMIRYLLDTTPSTEIWLFHSVKIMDDLLFKNDFKDWTKNGHFHYVPTFTRSSDVGFGAETGRIGEALLRKHLPLLEGTFFLCGPAPFVKDMEHVLAQGLKISPASIRREQW